MLPFTPRLRLALAYAEARRPHGVSSLDVLVGIMSLGGGVAVNILKKRGFAESPPIALPTGDGTSGEDPIQWKTCALTALCGAISEAVTFSHQLVGVEHMLAGILKSPSPEVAGMFADKRVSVEDVLSDLRNNM